MELFLLIAGGVPSRMGSAHLLLWQRDFWVDSVLGGACGARIECGHLRYHRRLRLANGGSHRVGDGRRLGACGDVMRRVNNTIGPTRCCDGRGDPSPPRDRAAVIYSGRSPVTTR